MVLSRSQCSESVRPPAGGTLCEAAVFLKEQGAASVTAAFTQHQPGRHRFFVRDVRKL